MQSFHDLIIRLQMRCTGDAENQLIELLLRLVHSLSAERCCFTHTIDVLPFVCEEVVSLMILVDSLVISVSYQLHF